MATKITTTKVLRHHFALKNGGTRFIDIDNPIDDKLTIANNISELNERFNSVSPAGIFAGMVVADSFFDGDTDAVVTSCTSAEIIETQKIVTTTDVVIS